MKYIKLYLACLLAFAGYPVLANHLVGGEFQITHKTGNNYEILLTVYGDAAGLNGPNGNEDQFVDVTTFDKQTNQMVESFRIGIDATSFVPYNNVQCQSGSVVTKILPYRITREMSPFLYNNPGGYYIVWERCCRNLAVVNILDPGDSGLVFYAEFPAVYNNNAPFRNSSPVLPPMPPDYLCVDDVYKYSMRGTDPDGDKLVYSLSEPMRGHTSSQPGQERIPGLAKPYALVNWSFGYNLNNMIKGNPPLTIDPVTGLLTVKPNTAGLFVFAITVSEFRNNVKIGEVRRDIQVKVRNCPTNAKPIITLRPPGATRDYAPGDTLLVTDATNYCYPIKFSDPDLGQTVTVKIVPLNFTESPLISPASGTVVQPGQVFNGQICWPDCNINSPNTLYRAALIISDNACANAASDTLLLTFRVIPKPNAKPQIITQGLVNNEATVTIGTTQKFNVIGTDSDNDPLTLRMLGTGFDPVAESMNLTPLTGQGTINAAFTWTPDCNKLKQNFPYELKFIVKDNACYADHSDTVSVVLRIKDVLDTITFLPPNIFTPNNDNHNDTFIMPTLPKDNCQDTFQEIKIYSRWGTQVFRSASRQFVWDGKNVSDGTYFYVIRFQKRKFKGYVNIVR